MRVIDEKLLRDCNIRILNSILKSFYNTLYKLGKTGNSRKLLLTGNMHKNYQANNTVKMKSQISFFVFFKKIFNTLMTKKN